MSGTRPVRGAFDDLAGCVAAAGQARAIGSKTAAVCRFEMPVPSADPLAWLAAAAPASPRLYWSAREGEDAVAGLGCACEWHRRADEDVASFLARLGRALAGLPEGVRLYGGLRFDPTAAAGAEWRPFGNGSFMLPEIEMIRRAGASRLACNVAPDADTALLAARIRALPATNIALPPTFPVAPHARDDRPDRNGWSRMLAEALRDIATGELTKIVLARLSRLSFDADCDPVRLLIRLRDVTRACFHFAFEPMPGVAFVGASPERLYARAARNVLSEAVAGTTPRGAGPAEEAALTRALVESDKEQREHVIVRDMIREALAPVCESLDIDAAPSVLKLARGQHLMTRVSGRLRVGAGDGELLARLHPTPAVGGCDTQAALERIAAWEPFDRGWYAGPVGWVSRHASEFAVAIRSALVRGAEVALYSGAGVVDGSTVDGEWEEIEHKIEDFARVFAAEDDE
jgi:menaquinone-specific isochorismate synthase